MIVAEVAAAMPFVAQQGPSWFEMLNQLFPILLVVVIGLLTLVKRLVERYVLKSRAEAESKSKPGESAPKPKSVMDEIKRYIDVIEGREGGPPPPPPTGPATAPATTAPPPPPAPPPAPPTVAPPASWTRRPARRRPDLASPLETGHASVSVSHRDLSFDVGALHDAMDVSHSELMAGSATAKKRLRHLAPVEIRRSKRAIREAFLWREILAPPPGLTPLDEPFGSQNKHP